MSTVRILFLITIMIIPSTSFAMGVLTAAANPSTSYSPQVYTIAQLGSTDLCATGTGVVDLIGVANVILLIDKPVTCTLDKTVPSTLGLELLPGGMITVSTTKTLTVNGTFEAPIRQQVFTLTGTGVVKFGPATLDKLYPQWWGAVSNDGLNDTTQIQQALTAAADLHQASGDGQGASAAVFLLSGEYNLTTAIKIPPAVRLTGESIEGTQLKPAINIDAIQILGADWSGGFDYRVTVDNLSIRIDSTSTGYMIKTDVAYLIKLENLFLWNTKKNGLYFNRCNQCEVNNVYLSGSSALDNSGVGVTVVDSSVTFLGSAIEFFQTGVNISKNISYSTVSMFGTYFELVANETAIVVNNSYGGTFSGIQIVNASAGITPIGISFTNGAHHNTIVGGNLSYGTEFALTPPIKTDATSYRNLVINSQVNGTNDVGVDNLDSKFSSINVTVGTLASGNVTGAHNVYLLSTNATPGTQTTRTATQMFTDHKLAQVGDSYTLRVTNSGAGTFTLGAGSGVTLTGTMTVATNTYRDFVVTFTSTTALTIQSVGTGPI